MAVLATVNKNFKELNPVVFGQEQCPSGHSHGPSVRSYVLIHHVLSGKGTFFSERGTFSVSEGEAFIILPGEVFRYVADKDEPWSYVWIGFDGTLSERFKELPAVFASFSHLFNAMLLAFEKKSLAEEYLAGKLFELYSVLFSGDGVKNDYILKIRNFVDTNYNGSCDVSEIASALNLELHYLSRLFRQKTGKTLKAYITEKRMYVAKQLLSEGKSVSYTASMTGYGDPFLFSKMFKKINGVSPAVWKKENGKDTYTKSG